MSFKLSASFLSLLVLVYQVQALVQNLEIANANIAPDGFNRSTTLAGGQFPGMLLTGNKNENFEITVIDSLTDTTMATATTVHWHGLFEANNTWSDGTAMVTQCPIVQGNSFLYNFTATDQAGTYWYHSHYGTQYCDGLRGPLIIYDPEDPHASLYDVDDETTIITLADWYHIVSSQEGQIPIPDAMLINGKGRYSSNPTADLAIINVEQGKRYRFRLIDMGCEANFVFQIDGHPFTIIEADGVNTEPLVVDSLQIFTGQRYSIIVEANQTVGNYWVRANPSLGTAGFDNGINSAILRYAGASDEEPTTTQATSTNPLNEVNLSPLENPGAPGNPVPGGADVNINLELAFDATALNFTINGESFVPPSVPVLLQILSGAQTAADLLPTGLVYTLPANKVIEVSIPGLSAAGGPHPFHLHGHVFDVVRSANSSTYNYANPVRRDTVSTGLTNDNVTIRFETDNAGPWILHCHIDWHLALGLAVVFAEDAPGVAATESLPTDWSQLCPAWNGKVTPTPQ